MSSAEFRILLSGTLLGAKRTCPGQKCWSHTFWCLQDWQFSKCIVFLGPRLCIYLSYDFWGRSSKHYYLK